ncbi:MAG: hypothetical protein LBB21_03240 [Holosporaceae bacterium]|nr:hypothetical protein [Holosporaceae bacterium]
MKKCCFLGVVFSFFVCASDISANDVIDEKDGADSCGVNERKIHEGFHLGGGFGVGSFKNDATAVGRHVTFDGNIGIVGLQVRWQQQA